MQRLPDVDSPAVVGMDWRAGEEAARSSLRVLLDAAAAVFVEPSDGKVEKGAVNLEFIINSLPELSMPTIDGTIPFGECLLQEVSTVLSVLETCRADVHNWLSSGVPEDIHKSVLSGLVPPVWRLRLRACPRILGSWMDNIRGICEQLSCWGASGTFPFFIVPDAI